MALRNNISHLYLSSVHDINFCAVLIFKTWLIFLTNVSVKPPEPTDTDKDDNSGKGWYVRYILSMDMFFLCDA